MMPMNGLRKMRARMGAVVAMGGVALVVAACGSSSTGASSSASASASASKAPASSTARVSVATAKGTDGTYLVGPSGRALYLWDADSHNKSVCSGACAQVWPPVTTTSSPVAAGGVTASQLGTITRSGGTKQVTYDGHPLYYFASDTSKGSLTGQGNNGFGAKWWLVAPTGQAITKTAAAASGASSSSSPTGY
jgi:predicted lipoprotein with Yx(FWY)xxD motif